MVVGLDTFRTWFSDHGDHYVLIGGVAAHLAMAAAGLDFRVTKDLDIVLLVEALEPGFVQRFWDFVQAGKYEQREQGLLGQQSSSACDWQEDLDIRRLWPASDRPCQCAGRPASRPGPGWPAGPRRP